MAENGHSIQVAFLRWIVGAATIIGLAVASWSLLRSIAQGERLILIEERLTRESEDDAFDQRQDSTIGKFWRLHSWERDQISTLRMQVGLPLESWPDLSEE